MRKGTTLYLLLILNKTNIPLRFLTNIMNLFHLVFHSTLCTLKCNYFFLPYLKCNFLGFSICLVVIYLHFSIELYELNCQTHTIINLTLD